MPCSSLLELALPRFPRTWKWQDLSRELNGPEQPPAAPYWVPPEPMGSSFLRISDDTLGILESVYSHSMPLLSARIVGQLS